MSISKINFYIIFFFSAIIYSDILSLPRISIITPYANDDIITPYLYDLSQQPFFNSVELILLCKEDNNNEDAVIRFFTDTCQNIKSVKVDGNCSQAHMFNEAIKASTAPLLTIIHIGDYRESTMMEKQISTLETDASIDLVYSDFFVVCEQNGFKDVSVKWFLANLPEVRPHLLYSNIVGTHYIWRKSLHEKYGYFKEDFNYSFLWEFGNRAVFNGACFKKLEGIAGNCYYSYFNPKKVFFSENDFEQSYQEDRYIKETYQSMWQSHYDFPEKHFVIVTASYNNKNWYKRNLDSVLEQRYNNFHLIYVDDHSPDETGELVQEYVKLKKAEDKITLIINDERTGATANIYHAIHMCNKDSIIIILDGDDWLAHNDVLNHLNAIYQDPNVWLTYGQFQWFPQSIPGFASALGNWVHEQNNIRHHGWVTTHLRSFYAGLYHNIKKEDLCHNGKFFEMTGDLAIMYPMVEMAGYHCKFVDEILYIYNAANSLNDHKVDVSKQTFFANLLKNQTPYQPLRTL